jgi:glycolate oxidase iron-sulfur subunit
MVTTSSPVRIGRLGLDADLLAGCVSCGLCLPHCPTFRVTGEEQYSPRGRIDAMRAVERGALPVEESFVDFVETCVQCRGCETACPSGVRFGALMEQTRTALAAERAITPWWQRAGFAVLARHRLLLAGSTMLAAGQRLRLVPARLGLPRLALRRAPRLRSTGTDVWIFTGCVMDAWMRDTHRNVAALVELAGLGYAVPGSGGGCCGALHSHAGLHDDASRLAQRVMASMPGDAPILVDSAGCGAAMKEYGRLLGTPEAERFGSRVLDVHEWLAAHLDRLPDSASPRPTVIVQDPCHLRHVQRAHAAVRTVLERVATVVELDDDGVCCGAGGAFSALQPELAGRIRERKVAAIERAVAAGGATAVVSANPGCAMHLGAVLDLPVRHPVDVVAELLGVTPTITRTRTSRRRRSSTRGSSRRGRRSRVGRT